MNTVRTHQSRRADRNLAVLEILENAAKCFRKMERRAAFDHFGSSPSAVVTVVTPDGRLVACANLREFDDATGSSPRDMAADLGAFNTDAGTPDDLLYRRGQGAS